MLKFDPFLFAVILKIRQRPSKPNRHVPILLYPCMQIWLQSTHGTVHEIYIANKEAS